MRDVVCGVLCCILIALGTWASPESLVSVDVDGSCPEVFLRLSISNPLDKELNVPVLVSDGTASRAFVLSRMGANETRLVIVPWSTTGREIVEVQVDPSGTLFPHHGYRQRTVHFRYDCENDALTFDPGILGDSCASPTLVDCDSEIYDNNIGHADSITTYSCSSKTMSGGETYYFFDNPVVQDVEFRIEPTGDARLDLFLLTDCDGATCLYEADQTMRIANLPVGYYTLVVDGEVGDAGFYRLYVTCRPHVQMVYEACFESGTQGFTSTGFWHRIEYPPHIVTSADMQRFVLYPDYPDLPDACEGVAGFWYGEDATGTFIGPYDPGQPNGSGGTSYNPNSGSLYSPPIDLTIYTQATLEFDCWWEIEGVDVNIFDLMYVEISTNGGGSWDVLGTVNPLDDVNAVPEMPYSSSGLNTPIHQCAHPAFTIDSYTGGTVEIRFRFETVDALYNAFRGWFVDCVRITASGGPPPILHDVEPECDVTTDTLIHIYGDQFYNGASVAFDGWPAASVSVISLTEILAYLPPEVPCPNYVTVTVTNPNGLSDTIVDAFICGANTCIDPLVADAGPLQYFCLGETVRLGGDPTASGGVPPYSYQWTPTTGLSDPTDPNPLASVLTPATYQVEVTDDQGMTAIDSCPLKPHDCDQVIVDAGPDRTINCHFPGIQLQGGATGGCGNFTYEWIPDSGLSDPNIPTPYCTVPGIYSLWVTDVSSGCQGVDTVEVFDGHLSPVASNTGPYCEGDTIALSGEPIGLYTYQWSGPAGFTSSSRTPTIPSCTLANAGRYDLTVTDTWNCSFNADTTVVVNVNPTAEAGPDEEACENDIPFDVTGQFPSGGVWSGTGITDPNAGTFSPSSVSPGNYLITYTYADENDCTNSDTKTITVHALPTVEAGPDEEACEGDSPFDLSGNSPAGGTWSGPGITDGANGTFDPGIGPGSYVITYEVTDANNCTASDTMTLTIHALPTVEAGPHEEACEDDAPFDLSGNSPPGGTWSGPGITDGANGTFDPATATVGSHTITYDYTDGNGCSGSDTKIVTVHALPAVEAGPAEEACENDAPFDLSGNNPAGGTWSGNGITDPNAGTFDPAAAKAGSHTITYSYTDGSNCTNSDTKTVTVGAPPSVEAGPDEEACENDAPFDLSGHSPAGGTWSGNGIIDPNLGTFDPAASGTGTFTITYDYTDGNGCSGSDTKIVTVHALPAVEAGPAEEACENDAAFDLSGNSPAGGTWSGPGITDPNAGTFDPATATAGSHTIKYSYTDANNCTNSDTKVVTVHAPPAVEAGPDENACENDAPFNLSGNSPAGGTWSGTGITDPNAGTFDPATATAGSHTITYSYTDANNCTNSDTKVVTVHAPPAVEAGPDENACENDAAFDLSGNSPAGGTWSGTGIVDANAGTFDPATATAGSHTTTYDYTDGNGCSGSDTKVVTVGAPPSVEAGPAEEACENHAAFDLSGNSPAGGTWSGTGITDPNAGTFDPATATAGSHTITYSYTDANNCTNSDTKVVTVHALPAVEAGPDEEACEGDAPFNLSGNSPPGGAWSGTGIIDANAGTFDPAAAGVGTFLITYGYTDGNGCSGLDTKSVTVSVVPSASAANTGPYCEGETISLIGGPDGLASYSWSGPDGFTSTEQNPNISNASLSDAGTYTLVAATAGGCADTAQTTVAVTSAVTVDVQPDGPTVVNLGVPVALSMTANGGSGYLIFQWTEDGLPISGATGEGVTAADVTGVQDNDPGGLLVPLAGFTQDPAAHAGLSFGLSGGTDLVNCVRVELEAPNSDRLVLKDYGAAPLTSYDVTAFYNDPAHGPGDYSLVVLEQNGCGAGAVDVSDVFMAIDDTITESYGSEQSHGYNCEVTDTGTASPCIATDVFDAGVQWVDPCQNTPAISCNFPLVSGDTSDDANLMDPSCGGGAGPEEMWRLTFSGDVGSQIDVTLPDPGWAATLYVLTDCQDPASCVAWSDSGSLSFNTTLTPQTFFIVVDGETAGDSGPYSDLEVGCPYTSTLDCGTATPAACGETHSGNTVGNPNDAEQYAGITGTFLGSEAIYSLTLPSIQNVDIYLENYGTRRMSLFLLEEGSCDVNQVLAGGVTEIHLDGLAAGTYTVIVDGRQPVDNGSFDLRFVCNEPATPPVCDFVYTITEPATYSWIDATVGTALSLGDDENSGFLALPFDFTYYETLYSQVAVSSNGWISFIDDSTTAPLNPSIPSAANPDAVIAPFWDNLDPSQSGTVYTQTFGTTPDRTFVVEWNNVRRRYSDNYVTFQVVLFETSNEILFQYQTMGHRTSSTIGLESPDGSQGHLRYYDNTPTVPDLTSYAIRFTPIGLSGNPDCTIPVPVACDTSVSGDTSEAGLTNGATAYTCSLDTYDGSEAVYEITLVERTVLEVILSNFGNRELDVFILDTCSVCECIAGGEDILRQGLDPGTYLIIVDGFDPSDNGPFDLEIVCTPCVDPAAHNRWTACENPRGATTTEWTSAFEWIFDDCDYCRDADNDCFSDPCTFDMYIVAECGTEMHMPLYDNETGNLRIYDMMAGEYVYLYAQSTGGWSAEGTQIQWQDCTGDDPRWNDQTTDIWFYGDPTLCGIYRAEFIDWGGYYWNLFSNCTGSNEPGFKIYDNYCEALAAYDPFPALNVDTLTITGSCPTYTVDYSISNAGCASASTSVVGWSDLGGTDSEIVTVAPGATESGTLTVNIQAGGSGHIHAYADFYDTVLECHEAGDNVTACAVSGSSAYLSEDVNCGCPIPQFSNVQVDDTDCPVGIQLTWEAAIFDSGSGHYDVYRSTVSFADAMAQPPVAQQLDALEYYDGTTIQGETYYYVVVAEDAAPCPGGCNPGAHGGLYTLVNVGPVTDNLQAAGGQPGDIGNELRAYRNPDETPHLYWPGAVPDGNTTHWHVFRSTVASAAFPHEWDRRTSTNAVDPNYVPVADPFFDDPDNPGTLYFYEVRAVNDCEVLSDD